MATTTARRCHTHPMSYYCDMDKELYTPEEAYETTMKDIKAIYDDAAISTYTPSAPQPR